MRPLPPSSSGVTTIGSETLRDGLRDHRGRIEVNQERLDLAAHEPVGVREVWVELLRERGTRRGVGLSHAGERELPRAQERELEVRGDFLELELAECLEDPRLVEFLANAREGDQRLDRRLGILLGERAFGPVDGQLVFDDDTGREADEAIRVREVRPRDVDRLGAGAVGVQRLERVP
jgi:hypothetical protein